jgi:hypothetical protein
MTPAYLKQIAASVEKTFQKSVRVELQGPDRNLCVITLPFQNYKGHSFYVWAFRNINSRKLQLSDGALLTTELGEAGTAQMEAIQLLVNSYGLSLMEDRSVMDISSRPLHKRITSFLQAMVAIDGVLRMWASIKEKA